MSAVLHYTEMESPIGPLTIVSTEKGICNIEFGVMEEVKPALEGWIRKHFLRSEITYKPKALSRTVQELSEYFRGERDQFNAPIDLYGTTFQKRVWSQLRTIQYGVTITYKDVAQAISAPKAVRAIGTAIGSNPIPIIIPCHRVIGSNGALVGYNGGLEKKEKLLLIENSLEKIS